MGCGTPLVLGLPGREVAALSLFPYWGPWILEQALRDTGCPQSLCWTLAFPQPNCSTVCLSRAKPPLRQFWAGQKQLEAFRDPPHPTSNIRT
jgi:hypothetical protein